MILLVTRDARLRDSIAQVSAIRGGQVLAVRTADLGKIRLQLGGVELLVCDGGEEMADLLACAASRSVPVVLVTPDPEPPEFLSRCSAEVGVVPRPADTDSLERETTRLLASR